MNSGLNVSSQRSINCKDETRKIREKMQPLLSVMTGPRLCVLICVAYQFHTSSSCSIIERVFRKFMNTSFGDNVNLGLILSGLGI